MYVNIYIYTHTYTFTKVQHWNELPTASAGAGVLPSTVMLQLLIFFGDTFTNETGFGMSVWLSTSQKNRAKRCMNFNLSPTCISLKSCRVWWIFTTKLPLGWRHVTSLYSPESYLTKRTCWRIQLAKEGLLSSWFPWNTIQITMLHHQKQERPGSEPAKSNWSASITFNHPANKITIVITVRYVCHQVSRIWYGTFTYLYPNWPWSWMFSGFSLILRPLQSFLVGFPGSW